MFNEKRYGLCASYATMSDVSSRLVGTIRTSLVLRCCVSPADTFAGPRRSFQSQPQQGMRQGKPLIYHAYLVEY